MNDPAYQNSRYTVSVHELEESADTLLFTFVPKEIPPERKPNGVPRFMPHFLVVVRQGVEGLAFDWSGTPDNPGAAREELEAEIAVRMKDRFVWIERVTALVGQVEQWAKERGWATRRVEKKLEDAGVGRHRVPALLMQEETCRILLEPVGRSAGDTEGVVDLYLMPAYDDIASLYYYDGRWNLHYLFPGDKLVADMREAKALPLSKETVAKVLAEMRQHAA